MSIMTNAENATHAEREGYLDGIRAVLDKMHIEHQGLIDGAHTLELFQRVNGSRRQLNAIEKLLSEALDKRG